MKLFRWFATSMMGLMLVSCVTINIYFPAAAAEKAADHIIEDIWGPDSKSAAEEAEAEQQSQLAAPQSQAIAMVVLNWLVSPASAEINLNINSAAVTSIQNKMKARHGKLKAYYSSGAVGLTDNGLVTVRDAKSIALKDRNKVKALVAEENKDRNALYAEIARANGHPEWKADIQSTFARRWVSNAASGWWYKSGGSWKQK
ncbi:MAG: hypothetical protein COA90_02500 [Gammaproteobacteria bacterium]|nr:MAG: hypothetical protein COA90_02500 [Gammaproteobacteria bacterium]